MSEPNSVDTLTRYRNETQFPFCPGCGHSHILNHLNAALEKLKVDPARVVIVSDIGCSGLSDEYFDTSAFHGLHGRSITYATGIKLARPDLKVIVIMGDGGTGIGGAHLLSAARRNIGITVLVFNNFNFGMTGGQHSTTTPPGAITATTASGNLERPLDICATVGANGAGYVWRGTNFDRDLPDRIAEAVQAECFALLDIWELCTAYYVPRNKASKKTLTLILNDLELQSGLLHRSEHPEYTAAYRAASAPDRGKPLPAPRPIEPRFPPLLDRPFRMVVAGSAGGKVLSSARLAGTAALLSGMWAAQRDDYPITIMTGHSIAELVLSPNEIDYSGIERPDAMILLSQDGASKVGRKLAAMEPSDIVFAVPAVADVKTRATVRVIDPAQSPEKLPANRVALYVLARAIRELGVLSAEALEAAASLKSGERAEETVATIRLAAGTVT